MASEVVTLADLLGKPEFHATKRMDRDAEQAILTHVRSRRTDATFPITTDDLTTLIEKSAAELDVYADLAEFGSGVEGVTLFQPGERPIVKISGQLSESASEKRLRSTLAHEFGHVLLHDPLFQRKTQEGLFARDRRYLQVCYRDDAEKPTLGDLFEYQAWYVCGAVLLPFSELSSIVARVAEVYGQYTDIWQHSELGCRLIDHAATIFGVSPQLARIRLLRTALLVADEPAPALF